jgi:ADP-ribose 1''-phosphate phosphatase
MGRLIYKQGSLFDAPKDSFLLHSCNCIGSFGAGVAKSFKELYPDLYRQYNQYCNKNLKNQKRSPLVGQSFIAKDSETGTQMVCLFTSQGYGLMVDTESMIVESTESALLHLSQNQMMKSELVEIHSPKINSGLFRVPWDKTEAKIKEFLTRHPNVTWTVWTID